MTRTGSVMKQIITNIETCRGCPHYDHSGGFTRGGALPICRAIAGMGQRVEVPPMFDEAVFTLPNAHCSVLPFTSGVADGLGGPRQYRAYTGEIPDWCPLPDAEKDE